MLSWTCLIVTISKALEDCNYSCKLKTFHKTNNLAISCQTTISSKLSFPDELNSCVFIRLSNWPDSDQFKKVQVQYFIKNECWSISFPSDWLTRSKVKCIQVEKHHLSLTVSNIFIIASHEFVKKCFCGGFVISVKGLMKVVMIFHYNDLLYQSMMLKVPCDEFFLSKNWLFFLSKVLGILWYMYLYCTLIHYTGQRWTFFGGGGIG